MPSKPKRPAQPERRGIVRRLASPVQRFIQTESSSGIVLVLAALVAFAWANSLWAESYDALRERHFALAVGGWTLDKSLAHWVNDGLMVIFFFLVGLEIKRELLVGELASVQKAALPGAAALGGMVVPALIYVAFNFGEPAVRGWGVPMATDIAFALGILALLGARVPLAVKVFLLALAIVDDLGAVLVIAVFYTENLDLAALLISLAIWALTLFYSQARVWRPLAFVVMALFMWYFMLQSGVHATIAGVLLAMAVPLRHRISVDDLRHELQFTAGRDFEDVETRIEYIERVLDRAHSPLHTIEHSLAPYVAFVIMPIFALFNAGVSVQTEGALINAVSLGAFLGLVLGKPVGVVGFAWLSLRMGLGRFPEGASWASMLGVGMLAGIGFTMSLFIANLAFTEPGQLDQAKIGVLAASTVAALVGLAFLHFALPKRSEVQATATRGAHAD